MFHRIFKVAGLSLLFAVPAAAQFGLPNKKKGGTFQELNEQAKQMQGGDLGDLNFDLAEIEKMMGELDPKVLEEMASLGPEFDKVMDALASMTPEELEAQMRDAMSMLQSGDMMENMLAHKDEVLKSLEETGQVDAEELAKFKTDPEYFEQKMKESFEQMGALFSDPEVLKQATQNMAEISDLYKNPDKIENMMNEIIKDFEDDEKIEEVRQLWLKNPDLGHPALKEMFEGEEMQEILKDPVKWRETVKEGQGLLNQGMAGAGVGEL